MKLYINYAYADHELVGELADLLQSTGHVTSRDLKLMPNQKWTDELLKAITDADALVYALSTDSVVTEWCLWCMAQAIKQGKPVIPVRLSDDFEIPNVLRDLQSVWFISKSDAQSMNALREALSDVSAYIVAPENAPNISETPHGIPAQAMGTGAPPGMRPPTSGRQRTEE